MSTYSNQLSFSLHPMWLGDGTAAEFLDPLRRAGLTAVEFTLHPHEAGWEDFPPLIAECQQIGLHCHLHAPYHEPYNAAGFTSDRRAEIKALHRPVVEMAAHFATQNDGPTTLVIHGARAQRPHDELYRDTAAFLEWLLSLETGLCLALENLPPKLDLVKIGSSRGEVQAIVAGIDSPKLGICWDMGHDVLAGVMTLPEKAFLRRVIHVHAHDVNDKGVDHFPLTFGRVPCVRWLRALVATGYKRSVTLEVSGRRTGIADAKDPASVRQLLVDSLRQLGDAVSGG